MFCTHTPHASHAFRCLLKSTRIFSIKFQGSGKSWNITGLSKSWKLHDFVPQSTAITICLCICHLTFFKCWPPIIFLELVKLGTSICVCTLTQRSNCACLIDYLPLEGMCSESSAWVGHSVTSVCLSVSLFFCPRSDRKTA